MILTSDILENVRARIDAGIEDTDDGYYSITLNFVPALNATLNWIMTLFASAMERKRSVATGLRELRVAVVYETSSYSRIFIEDDIFYLESVNPLPVTTPVFIPTGIVLVNSEKRTDLYHVSSNFSAKELTKEQWENNALNPFSDGNILSCSSNLAADSRKNVRFAYLEAIDYFQEPDPEDEYQAKQIEIRPYLNRKPVTLFYIVNHPKITYTPPIETEPGFFSGNILFPNVLYTMLIEKIVQYISYEQGDASPLFDITDGEINKLISLF